MYLALIEKHNLGRRPVSLAEGIKEGTHALLRRGGKTRTRAPDHPSTVRDIRGVYNTGCGKRKRSDARIVTPPPRPRAPPAVPLRTKLYRLTNQQKTNTWRSHQSLRHKESR